MQISISRESGRLVLKRDPAIVLSKREEVLSSAESDISLGIPPESSFFAIYNTSNVTYRFPNDLSIKPREN
ncbi:hypothetical protein V2J09_012470 [Rumex salicifolius]